MADRWEHARSIGPALAASLAELERRSAVPVSAIDWARVERAIAQTWGAVVDDVKADRFDLSVPYLSRVHGLLAEAAGTESPGQFWDKGETAPTEWSVTVGELTIDSSGFDSSYLSDAIVLAELRWGGHVRSLGLSLGWLCFNGSHLRGGMWAIYPPPGDHYQLLNFLGYAGPDCWDPESLRALLGGYTDSQKPG